MRYPPSVVKKDQLVAVYACRYRTTGVLRFRTLKYTGDAIILLYGDASLLSLKSLIGVAVTHEGDEFVDGHRSRGPLDMVSVLQY